MEKHAVYKNWGEFWIDRYQTGRLNSTLQIPADQLDEEQIKFFKPIWRHELMRLVDTWKKESGRDPVAQDFRLNVPGKINVVYDRLMGTDAGSYFDSAVEFWLARKKHDPSTELVRVSFRSITKAEGTQLRPHWKKEAQDLISEWQKKNPDRILAREDFGFEEGKIPLVFARLCGVEKWAIGSTTEHNRIGDSRFDFWNEQRKLDPRIFMLKIKLQNLTAEEASRFRPYWRQEAFQILKAWKDKKGRMVRSTDFSLDEGNIPLIYARPIGDGPAYHPETTTTWLYASKADFLSDFQARERGEVPLIP